MLNLTKCSYCENQVILSDILGNTPICEECDILLANGIDLKTSQEELFGDNGAQICCGDSVLSIDEEALNDNLVSTEDFIENFLQNQCDEQANSSRYRNFTGDELIYHNED